MRASAGGPARRLTLRRQRSEIARLAPWVEAAAAALAIAPGLIFRVQLCLEEAVTNVIEHGGAEDGESRIVATLTRRGGDIAAGIEDDGPPFDPTAASPPPLATTVEEAHIGGLGLRLVRQFAASAAYERRAGRNRLMLIFAATP